MADGYRPSPRPTFDSPTVIPIAQATRHVWGDAESGEVLDRIYVSSGQIHQLLFEIPAGGEFRHSADFRTIFGADEVLYVVEGTVAFADPAVGEVVRAGAGEAVFFRRDTWHHAFNWGPGAARVLEFFAPPPVTGASGSYAQQQPLLTSNRYADDSVLGRHVPGASPAPAGRRFAVIRETGYRWRLDGDRDPVLIGLLASTEHLTVARGEVRGTGWSGWLGHEGDASGYVLAGSLLLRHTGASEREWHQLGPGDGFFVPESARYQLRNGSGDSAVYLVGAAPSYGPGTCSPT
jgi:mannose-6-phosphate isomerase-like protein (cupin superfamily)